MSRVSSPSRRASSPSAASPAVAGFRPRAAAVAVAAAFALQPALLQAQPAGAQAVHGQATFSATGSNLVVTTQNGAGTNHSAINWQSFSVPAGSTTRFVQPSAASTSINRVLGPDPSAIYGTLSSNGKLVLVNPAGIAVGPGGVVDTAGFTASTLSMSEADAIAGRLLFQGGTGGLLQVDGHVIARSGDIFLIGSQVQAGASAVVQSNGATVLAAGEKVAITGRGLEGIHLEVQAGNEARNLGTLRGDAVGVFAGTLRHSGLIVAEAVSTEGGKVVLKAMAGDALVEGQATARSGDKGGSIDVLGQRVGLLAGANLDASGAAGGGQVRVGGDYQGLNADVPNAARTYVDAAAVIRADATQQGDGGRVIVWSDEVTRMHGQISARGGAQGGDGGFVEVSGKQYLAYTGLTDLSAPQGALGTLLLDPQDVTIIRSNTTADTVGTFPISEPSVPLGAKFEPTNSTGAVTLADSHLSAQLGSANVIVKTDSTVSAGSTGGQITVNADAIIQWSSGTDLAFQADKGIAILGTVQGTRPVSSGNVPGLHLVAKNGDIVDGGTGRISVPDLYASATNGSVLLRGSHAIETVAGKADSPGATFAVHSNQALTVGAVSTEWGGGAGITSGTIEVTSDDDLGIVAAVGSASGGGGVTAKAGRYLSVNADISSQGGPVTLAGGTLATEGAVYIGRTATVSSGGGQVAIESLKSDVGGTSLAVDGVVDAGAGGIDVKAQSLDVTGTGVLKRSGAGDLGLRVDGLNLANSGGTSLESNGGRIVINPLNIGDPAMPVAIVGSGGIGIDGGFNLYQPNLDQMKARTLVVGSGSLPKDIRLEGAIVLDASRVQELSLITAGNLSQSASGSLAVAGVNLDAASVSATSAGNVVSTVSGRFDNVFDFQSGGTALTIGTVDGIAGVQQRSATTASYPGIHIVNAGGALDVAADVKANDTKVWLQGATVNLAAGATVSASGPFGGVAVGATGNGTNDLAGTIAAGSYVDIGGEGTFKLGNIFAPQLSLTGGSSSATVFQQQAGSVVDAGSVYASLGAIPGSLLSLTNTGNKIGSLGGYVAGDVKVYSSQTLDIGYVQAGNVSLQAANITLGVENGISASGDISLAGTSKGSVIDLRGGYVGAAGNLGFSNAADAILGNTDADTLSANLAGSLMQDTSSSASVQIRNGVSFNVGGSVSLVASPLTSMPNSLGYVTGTAGGDIAMDGVRGVAAAGIQAGGNLSLAAPASASAPVFMLSGSQLPLAMALTAPTDLDIIGNVTAGGTATLKSDSAVVVQDTATVKAASIEMVSPFTSVYGTLQPGGAGGIGAVKTSGHLVFGGSGTMQLDVASLTSFDTLTTGGDASSDLGTSLKVVDLTGGTLSGSFSPVMAGPGSALAFSVPANWTVTPINPPSPYIITAGLAPAPVPAPAPAPAPAPVGDAPVDEVFNQVVTFASLFVAESERQEEKGGIGKDDIVFTDTACKPQ